MKSIGFDFDDTMTDTVEYCYEMFKVWHRDVARLGNYTGGYFPSNYDVKNRFKGIPTTKMNQFAVWYFNKMNYDAPARKGLKETIDVLHEFKFETHIITRRSTKYDRSMTVTGPIIKTVTMEWLKKNRIAMDTIHFNAINKAETMKEHGIEVLVEDAALNIQTVSPYYPVIIIDQPWNQGVDFSNTYRIKDFDPDVMLGILTKFEEWFEK